MERSLVRFLRHHRSAGSSPKTTRFYEQNVSLFVAFCNEHGYSTDVDALEADTVRDWIEEQRERGLSPASVASRVRALKAFTSWLTDEEWLTKDPLRKLKLPKVGDIQKDTLSPQDVDKLLETCNLQTITGVRDKAIILLLYSTGLRANEALDLRTEDIAWSKGLITIRRGKGGKLRVVPLGAKLEKALTRYLDHKLRPKEDGGRIFVTDEGQPMNSNALRDMLRRREAKTGIHCNPHKFRHSAAIQYLRSGGRIETLRAMLGHTTLDMTLHYARIAGVDLTEAHELADPAKALKSRG